MNQENIAALIPYGPESCLVTEDVSKLINRSHNFQILDCAGDVKNSFCKLRV
jgi:hypothetical protein